MHRRFGERVRARKGMLTDFCEVWRGGQFNLGFLDVRPQKGTRVIRLSMHAIGESTENRTRCPKAVKTAHCVRVYLGHQPVQCFGS